MYFKNLFPVTTEPDLETCTIQITSPSTLTSTCYINVTDTHYINYIPTGLTARWDTSFSLSSAPPEPQYVDSYSIGISEASVVASVYRMDSCKKIPLFALYMYVFTNMCLSVYVCVCLYVQGSQ